MKTVAIIGAGASGLAAIKTCVEEGLSPTCFERTDVLGGTWYYTGEDTEDGRASVFESTIINTSKEIMTFSDFPIPKEYPIFMHNRYVQRYFELYADKFGMKEHIRFKTEVVYIKKAEDFKETGRWEIQVKNRDSCKVETSIFDAVMLCTGHHAMRNIPEFEGLDKFKGRVLHSHLYKNTVGFEKKRVLIVGIGNSGGDAAVELSRVSSQVYLSTRRGTWVYNRISTSGLPLDLQLLTRAMDKLSTLAPNWARDMVIRRELNNRMDHKVYSLEPEYGPFAQHIMVNDDLANRLAGGSIIVKSDIKRFTETGVEFTDGTSEDDIDVVILATGFIFGFPYLDKEIIDVQNNRVNLYKYAFVPDLEHQTLSVIGCVQPLGAVNPISEIQCRAAVKVFKKESKLPYKDDMWRDIHCKQEEMSKNFVKTQRHTIQVKFIEALDEMAEIVGCKPNLRDMFTTDLKLWYHCFFGPCTPYQYRLTGPGAWPGARDAIFSQWDRTLFPLKTRPLASNKSLDFPYLFIVVLFIVILSILIKLIFF